MWLLPVTRRELVDLITPRHARDVSGALEENRPSFDIVRPDVMAAAWPARPTEFGHMPTAIIVPEGSRRDSLAWLATYVRDFRPFTAYCRVVERPVAEQFLKGPSAPHLQGDEGICSGLILGEALTHARGRASILDLPASVYSATLSHAISRTLALTGGSVPLDVIADLWTQSRETTGQNGLGLPPSIILSVWAVALATRGHPLSRQTLFDSADVLAAAWSDLATHGEIRDPIWRRLVEGYADLEQMRALIRMPREQRVQMVDVALRQLATSRQGVDERPSFLAGYFTSLLAPGTIDHTDILVPVAPLLPTAFLWYGLCASVNFQGDALPVGNPLARRIVRDLTIPDRVIDRPRCDIALEELTMHGSGDSLLRLTARTGRLDVDILPGVTMSVRWPYNEASREGHLFSPMDMEVQHLLVEIEETMMRSQHLTERLRQVLRGGEGDAKLNARRKKGGRS